LKASIPQKEEIDVFLHEPSWVKYDSIIGYVLNDKYLRHDGLDDSYTMVTSQQNGARTQFLYKDQKCRINTYGNSFTQSSQVSDGETWQEYLAAHLGEPIRNYGVGGLGTYQAYRRMLREEKTEHGAEYVVLYVWGNDHLRSLLRCRYILSRKWHEIQYKKEGIGKVFHGNFWANIEMDMSTGKLTERKNRISLPENLYQMCDTAWMVENLKDDLALQMFLYKNKEITSIDIDRMRELSSCLKLEVDWDDKEKLYDNVSCLLDQYGFAATRYVLERAQAFAEERNKKLMVILFSPYKTTLTLIKNGTRYDQTIVDYLDKNGFMYFDMNQAHVEDYKSFNLSIEDYYKRYFIGHYNPAGNHFFAYSLKTKMVEWLDPKPVTYKISGNKAVDFNLYLEGVTINE